MDLEVARFVSSTIFLVLLLVKQYVDGLKLSRQYGEAVDVFRGSENDRVNRIMPVGNVGTNAPSHPPDRKVVIES